MREQICRRPLLPAEKNRIYANPEGRNSYRVHSHQARNFCATSLGESDCAALWEVAECTLDRDEVAA
jgi:hypothetical protein